MGVGGEGGVVGLSQWDSSIECYTFISELEGAVIHTCVFVVCSGATLCRNPIYTLLEKLTDDAIA